MDYIAILRPFVGTDLDMSPEKYRSYLRERGIEIADEDADLFFRYAVKINRAEAQKAAIARNRKDAYNYLASSNPLVDFLMEKLSKKSP